MSDIDKLQQRVVEAEKRFGLIAEQRAKYSQRLIGLITAIETRLVDQQTEIERQAGEVASQGEELEIRRRDSAENKLLRGMLQSLLSAIEAGSRDTLSETMQAMDAKVSALLAGNAATAAPEAPEAAPAMDAPEPETLEAEPEEAETGSLDEDPEAVASPPVTETPEEPETTMAEPETCGADDPRDESEGPDAPDGTLEHDPLQEAVALDEPEADAGTPAEPETLAAALDEPEADAGTPVEPEMLAVALDEPEADAETPAEPETLAAAGQDEPEAAAETPAEPEMLATLAQDEPQVDAEAPADPAPSSGLENLIDEDAAVPGVATAGNAGDVSADTASLEDIMRRVSKLVEEEGALGPLSEGSVRIETEAETPDSETPEPPQKAASNG